MLQGLESRRTDSQARLKQLTESLTSAASRAKGLACVYVIGSFGRGEACSYSDLDLFIVGRQREKERALSKLEEICVKADLIEVARKMSIPDFSGDGEYLRHYTVNDLVASLGKADDDHNNTFTARLLMLLESRPLFGQDVYDEAIGEVITAYWRDYEEHKGNFRPTFLANDILRLWRTFCVNYEARTEKKPNLKLAKRRLKNYKLKHSRLLTCFSGLAYLLAVHATNGTVSPDDACAMVALSPTQRLEWLPQQEKFAKSRELVDSLLARYDAFLQATNQPEADLVDRFMDETRRREYTQHEHVLGERMFDLLRYMGDHTNFYRVLVV